MPKISGLDLCRHIFERKYSTKVMILSGYGEFEYAKQAIQYGVSEYLLKPILKEEFEEILEKMLERHFAEEIKKQEKTGDIVQEVETYIREHVEDDLSLELLAGVVHLNPSYLSRYFKDSTGENLSNFVTRCKMEKACRCQLRIKHGCLSIQNKKLTRLCSGLAIRKVSTLQRSLGNSMEFHQRIIREG